MHSIILTAERKDGIALQQRLLNASSSFKDISPYVKEDLLSGEGRFKEVQFVFSTWYMPQLSAEEIKEYLPSLKAVFYAAGTVKYFAKPFLASGVRVFSAAKANGASVAEFVAAQVLLANKGYFQAQKAYKSVLWRLAFQRARRFSEKRKGNYGARIGLIGCGSVGEEVVRLLKPYRLEILVYDPYLPEEKCQALGVTSVGLEYLFENCDVVSNHLPDIPSTLGLIDYGLLNRLHDYSTFINTGRGAQVVEADLARLLRKRPSICALLDGSRHEPPFPWSPLLRRRNLFLSPHIAGSLGDESDRLVEFITCAYEDYCAGREPKGEIELNKLELMA